MCVHVEPDGVSVSIRAHNKHRIKEGAVSSAVPCPFPAAPAGMTPDFPSSGTGDRTPGAGRFRPPEVYWHGSLKDMETHTHLFSHLSAGCSLRMEARGWVGAAVYYKRDDA